MRGQSLAFPQLGYHIKGTEFPAASELLIQPTYFDLTSCILSFLVCKISYELINHQNSLLESFSRKGR